MSVKPSSVGILPNYLNLNILNKAPFEYRSSKHRIPKPGYPKCDKRCLYLVGSRILCLIWIDVSIFRKQEYSSRTLGATWGIISAVMLPIVIVLICIGWRILKRRKAEEKEEIDYMIKTRPIDPDESVKINSDDESIPYKKDVSAEDSPLPTESVKVVDNNTPFNYGVPYPAEPYQTQSYEPADGYVAQPYNETGLPEAGLPEVGLPETGLPETGQPKSNQQRQWTGETEIN